MIDYKQKLLELGYIVDKAKLRNGVWRCHTIHKPRKDNGWYRVFDNLVCYGDWAGDIEDGYFYLSEMKPFTEQEKRDWAKKKADEERLRLIQKERDLQERRNEINRYTREVLPGVSSGANNHAYLVKKQMDKRWDMIITKDDVLTIPLYSISGEVVGYQYIYPDGTKRFKTGSILDCSFYPLRNPGVAIYQAEWILFTEGVATADSVEKILEEYTDSKFFIVIATISAGNLPKVVRHFDRLCPNADKLIMADNDPAGIESAKATGHKYIIMGDNHGEDVNDVFCNIGLDKSVKLFHEKLEEVKHGE